MRIIFSSCLIALGRSMKPNNNVWGTNGKPPSLKPPSDDKRVKAVNARRYVPGQQVLPSGIAIPVGGRSPFGIYKPPSSIPPALAAVVSKPKARLQPLVPLVPDKPVPRLAQLANFSSNSGRKSAQLEQELNNAKALISQLERQNRNMANQVAVANRLFQPGAPNKNNPATRTIGTQTSPQSEPEEKLENSPVRESTNKMSSALLGGIKNARHLKKTTKRSALLESIKHKNKLRKTTKKEKTKPPVNRRSPFSAEALKNARNGLRNVKKVQKSKAKKTKAAITSNFEAKPRNTSVVEQMKMHGKLRRAYHTDSDTDTESDWPNSDE